MKKLNTYLPTHCTFTTQMTVNFLPVGHTHEDVDQMFPRISEALRRIGADSVDDVYIRYALHFVEH